MTNSMIFRAFFLMLIVFICCECSRKTVVNNTRNTSYADSLVGIVEYDPDGEFNNTIDDSDTIEPAELNEPEISYIAGLRIKNLNYSQRIFVRYEIMFDTVVNETIKVKDITRIRMSTYNRVIPDSVLKKDSVLQKKVYDRLIHNVYTTKDDIQGKHIFGTAVVLCGK